MPATLSRGWLLMTFGVAAVMAPLPYVVLALVLLIAQGIKRFVIGWPGLKLAISLWTVFLLPLSIAPVISVLLPGTTAGILSLPFFEQPLRLDGLIAVAFGLPAIYLVALDLQFFNLSRSLHFDRAGYRFTRPAVALAATTAGLLPAAVVVGNPVLFAGATTFALLLLFALWRALAIVRRDSIELAGSKARLLAGGELTLLLSLRNPAGHDIYGCLCPEDDWLSIVPGCFMLTGQALQLSLSINRPPLSGPQYPIFDMVVSDLLGLAQRHQKKKPLQLEIIPRARYARHLALRYLSGGAGTGLVGLAPLSGTTRAGRGMDYLGSRPYQPGDRLKDIDWKHSLKLNDTVAKEYARTGGQSAVILASFDVPGAEAADKLGFNLISAALTLAQEGVPAALALYNRDGVILVTALENPDLTLRRLLGFIKDIRIVPVIERRLQPAEIATLRRNINLLEQFASPGSDALLALLDFEKRAIESASKSHPVTTALASLSSRLSPPAAVIVASTPSDDAETLALALDRWRHKGYEVLTMDKGTAAPRR